MKLNHESERDESFFTKSLKIAGVVALYWFVSISMVFLNKYLLSSSDFKLDAPFFITWYQCVITVALCALMGLLAKLFPDKVRFPPFKIDPKMCRETLPMSIVFVAMISFNNLCLMHLGVAFYFVGRSLTTVFNVMMTYFVLKQTTSLKAIMCCGVIVFGFFLGVSQESNLGSLSVLGVVFGVMASACVALNAIYQKKTLPLVDQNVLKLTMYNNINASILFLPLMMVFGEFGTICSFPKIGSIYFWVIMTITGVFGFSIGYVTGLQIKYTSPLTHNISGTAKACAQTIIACAYYHDVKPTLWWTSTILVLAGSGSYTEVRRQEMKQIHDEKLGKFAAKLPMINDSSKDNGNLKGNGNKEIV